MRNSLATLVAWHAEHEANGFALRVIRFDDQAASDRVRVRLIWRRLSDRRSVVGQATMSRADRLRLIHHLDGVAAP